MKRQHKVLSTLIAGLLGTTLVNSAAAITALDIGSPNPETYAQELKNDTTIGINTAYVTKLGAGELGDTEAAIFAGKTSYVRIDFDNATIATDSTVEIGGAGSALTYTPGNGTAGNFGIGRTTTATGLFDYASEATYSAAGGKQTGSVSFVAHTDGACFDATDSVGLVGTDGIRLSNEAKAGGLNYAIFALTESGTNSTAVTAGSKANVLAGCKIGFYINKLVVKDTSKPVKMSYSLHTNNVSASSALGTPASTPVATKKDITVINFSPALTYGVTSKEATSDVTKEFTKFKSGYPDTETAASVATIKFGVATGVKDSSGNLIASGGSILADASNNMSIKGDFTSIAANKGKVYLADDLSCSTSNTLLSSIATLPNSATAGESSVDLSVSAGTLFTSEKTAHLCLDVGDAGTASGQIVATDNGFVITFKPTTKDGYKSLAEIVRTGGRIIRNGAELEAPFVSTNTGYTNRIILSNLSSSKVPFTVKFATDGVGGSRAAGSVLPTVAPVLVATGGSTGKPAYGVDPKLGKSYHAMGEIPPKTLLFINVNEQLATVANGGRLSAVFTFQADNSTVQGVFQMVNQTTKEVTSVPMVRKGGGNGN